MFRLDSRFRGNDKLFVSSGFPLSQLRAYWEGTGMTLSFSSCFDAHFGIFKHDAFYSDIFKMYICFFIFAFSGNR